MSDTYPMIAIVKVGSMVAKDFIPFGASFCGAFFGALGAFIIAKRKEKRDELKRKHTALLQTQYALYSQWNSIESIRKILEPFRDKKDRHFHLKTIVQRDACLRVPFTELTFLIDSDEPLLLQEIHLAEAAYLTVIDILERHNTIRQEIGERVLPTNVDLETYTGTYMIPAHELLRLKPLTDCLYSQVDMALPTFSPQVEAIYAFVKRNLKGKKAIRRITPNKTPSPDK